MINTLRLTDHNLYDLAFFPGYSHPGLLTPPENHSAGGRDSLWRNAQVTPSQSENVKPVFGGVNPLPSQTTGCSDNKRSFYEPTPMSVCWLSEPRTGLASGFNNTRDT